jgi:Zn-dependent protease
LQPRRSLNAYCRNPLIVPSFRRFARSFGHSVPAGETDFMRKLLLFFMGMIVGAGLMTFAFKYHVMYSKDGLVLIPKSQASLSDLYVDVRNW